MLSQLSGWMADANPQPQPFEPSTLPGIWRQTASGPAQFSRIGLVTPFALPTPTYFLPAPFPQLESSEYAANINEIQSLGSVNSTTRTPRQTMLAQLVAGAPGPWANVSNPVRIWHNVTIDVAVSQDLTTVQTARLFAMVSAAMFDSVQTLQTSKFMLANVLRSDSIPFHATWYLSNDAPTVVHSEPYDSFWAFAVDAANSRLWGGIHYTFELTTSQHSCVQVADFVFDHRMRKLPTS
jgi:hypothetical protein